MAVNLIRLDVQVRTVAALSANPVNIAVPDVGVHYDATLGVLGWFQVLDFDLLFGFLFLVLHFSFPLLGCFGFVLCQ